MKQFGLIGKRLSYSLSQKIFEQQFQDNGSLRYDLFELQDLAQLDTLIRNNPDLQGFNVTSPYKQEIMSRLTSISPEAKEIGAVNVVKIVRHENAYCLYGYNTDVVGFLKSVEGTFLPRKALIFGTGGAAAAVAFALRKLGITYRFVSRNKGDDYLTYASLTENIIQEYPLLINCTPMGTANTPLEGISLWEKIPVKIVLSDRYYLYDLVYNPEESPFLKKGRDCVARAQNGLKMLQCQAEAAWTIWDL